MTSSPNAALAMPNPKQTEEIMRGLGELLSLIAPLKAVLANSAALGGGASQRLHELVEVLHGTGNGLAFAVEDLKRIYGLGGEMDQMRSQITEMERSLERQEIKLESTHTRISAIMGWLNGKA